jgi:hypothetical protein
MVIHASPASISCLPRAHFDSVRSRHDENIGSADKESAFNHAGDPVEPGFKSSGIFDPRDVQI